MIKINKINSNLILEVLYENYKYLRSKSDKKNSFI